MKRKLRVVTAIILLGALLGCAGSEIKVDEATVTLGKIIARRLGVATANQYPLIATQVEPIAKAILESAANGDDLITILKKGLAQTIYIDALTKKDIEDLIDLIEVNNIPEVYTEIAQAFLEGIALYIQI